jgi:molybdate transport system substrate-binding protein
MTALALSAGCRGAGAPRTDGPLRVSAAISLSDVLTAETKRWEAAGHGRVDLNFAASNVLARQLLEGAPVDVFISADGAQMDRVIDAGAVDAVERVTLFTNQLVVITPAGRPLPGTAPESLADTAIKRVAIGDPQGVPAGVYAKAWLEKAGLWRRVEPKVVPAGSVRAALAAVEAANADAGVVYRTDVNGNAKVAVAYEVPLADAPSILYPGAVVKRAAHATEAHAFLGFLLSAQSRKAFAAAGFLAPDSAAR